MSQLVRLRPCQVRSAQRLGRKPCRRKCGLAQLVGLAVAAIFTSTAASTYYLSHSWAAQTAQPRGVGHETRWLGHKHAPRPRPGHSSPPRIRRQPTLPRASTQPPRSSRPLAPRSRTPPLPAPTQPPRWAAQRRQPPRLIPRPRTPPPAAPPLPLVSPQPPRSSPQPPALARPSPSPPPREQPSPLSPPPSATRRPATRRQQQRDLPIRHSTTPVPDRQPPVHLHVLVYGAIGFARVGSIFRTGLLARSGDPQHANTLR